VTSYPIEYAIYDSVDELLAHVRVVDEYVFGVSTVGSGSLFTVESWREFSAQVEQAMVAMNQGAE
jgi:hypothetical protein